MILVTTGTVKGFRTMIERMDRLAAGRLSDHEVVAQIANCDYEPAHMAWFRYMEEVQVLFAQAELIVGHGGTGTTVEALKLGKRFVGVSDPTLPDDHQCPFLEELASRKLLVHCRNVEKLDEAIEHAWRLDPAPIDTTGFGRSLARSIEADLCCRSEPRTSVRADARP